MVTTLKDLEKDKALMERDLSYYQSQVRLTEVDLAKVQKQIDEYDDYPLGTVAQVNCKTGIAVKVGPVHKSMSRMLVPEGGVGWLTILGDASGHLYDSFKKLREAYPTAEVVYNPDESYAPF